MNKEKGKIFDLKIFSELMHFVKPYKGTYYFVMGAAILLSIFSTLSPYLLKSCRGRLHSTEGLRWHAA